MIAIFVETVHGLPSLRLDLPAECSNFAIAEEIRLQVPAWLNYTVHLSNGRRFPSVGCAKDLASSSVVHLSLKLPLLGGKGGFGSMLKAQGNKMSKKQGSNNNEYKNLQGQRLKRVKQLQTMKEAMKKLPEVQRAKLEAKRKQLQKILDTDLSKISSAEKCDDTEALEESEMILDEIREAVAEVSDNGSNDHSEEEWESDWNSDDEVNSTSTKESSVPNYTSFFDD